MRGDIAEVRTEDGKLYMFVAIDRTSKFAFAKLEQKANRRAASAFLESLIEAIPYKIHTVLTDNGVQFTFPPRHRDGPTARYVTHMFEMRCHEHGIDHRLTKPNHPWTTDVIDKRDVGLLSHEAAARAGLVSGRRSLEHGLHRGRSVFVIASGLAGPRRFQPATRRA